MEISEEGPVLTAKQGTNADLFPDILRLYVEGGAEILDMTYGNGVFWRHIPDDQYTVTKNDRDPGRGDTHHDFRALPAAWDESYDAVIFDPPYLYTGGFRTLRDSIDRGYRNRERARSGITGVAAVHQMYAQGFIEAYRVLRQGGVFIVKCMDQVMSGKQTWMHTEMFRLAEILGFKTRDLFVMVANSTPTMRHRIQRHARRNHSYFLVLNK
jgi:hypothetical protein